jgi:hypothetical protein
LNSLLQIDMNVKTSGPITLGVIIGNRDFFPDKLVGECRADLLDAFQKVGIKPIMLDESATKLGGVETFQEAQKCAELFRQHADEIMGVLVVLPNFGDEKGVAETLKLARLDVPVLIQAYPDDLNRMDVARRRDGVVRKNLGLQQPVSVWNQVFTDDQTRRTPLRPQFCCGFAQFYGRLPGR